MDGYYDFALSGSMTLVIVLILSAFGYRYRHRTVQGEGESKTKDVSRPKIKKPKKPSKKEEANVNRKQELKRERWRTLKNTDEISKSTEDLRQPSHDSRWQTVKKSDEFSKSAEDLRRPSQTEQKRKQKKPKRRSSVTVSSVASKTNAAAPQPLSNLSGEVFDASPSQEIVIRHEEERQRIQEIEVVRQILHENARDGLEDISDTPEEHRLVYIRSRDSGHSGDISTAANECDHAPKTANGKRRRKYSRSISSTGTVTPRLPKLVPEKAGSNYLVEIDQSGGIVKLPDATLKVTPASIKKKMKLFIFVCRNQKTRRGDEHAIFLTHAVHLWLHDSSQSDSFTFHKPVTVRLAKNSSKAGVTQIQKTESVKDISWEFFKDCGHCDGDQVSFTIDSLGGYRTVIPKFGDMADLHCQVCVRRRPDNGDPDQHIFLVRFYTDDVEKSVLDEVQASPELQILHSDSIKVRTESVMRVSLFHNECRRESEFNVPKIEGKLKKTISISVKRPIAYHTLEPQGLYLQLSSQFSRTISGFFHFNWNERVIIPPTHINAIGPNSIGIQNNIRDAHVDIASPT